MHPFDWRTILLAKHAQHVVLIHFPIALFIVAAALDLAGHWSRNKNLLQVAYINLTIAAACTIPAILTGLAAWQWALEGQRLKGVLLYHLASALLASFLICTSWWIHFRQYRRKSGTLPTWRFAVEAAGVLLVGLAGHLGGFLSGVNS